ncbi:MAG: DUF2815 family protein [Mesorhizobium sp.]|uniref:ssDNA-binding protein n=1 Tax=Mesorhizobium sp. TaxID=1871066 RepID=UPI000FE8D495|nr:ssDNA-binding protein [Mesorhizobium sp.]RWA81467.1 MAG: DUF2815 family protein [Mesorhizobium sp.]
MASKQKFARSEDFKTPPCRILYAFGLFKTRKGDNGKETYQSTLVFENQHKAALEKYVGKVIIEQWGEKGIERAKQGLIKSPFLAGDGKEARDKASGEINEGLGAGLFFIRPWANADHPPVVRYKDPNIPATEAEVYSGCRGFAVLSAFAWHNDQNGDGVSFNLAYFQKTADDTRIGNSGAVDAGKWHEKIEDAGDAPSETKQGAGAGGLFG